MSNEPPARPLLACLRDRWALAVVLVVLGAAIVLTKALLAGDPEPATGPIASTPPPAATTPAPPRTVEERLAAQPGTALALKVTRRQLLRTRPAADGQLVKAIGTKTDYGSQVILPIIKAKGDWVALVSPYRANNRVAWTKVKQPKLLKVNYSMAVRVRSRSIIVRKNGKVVRRMKAAVGRAEHPTPPGRYTVTDGLIFKKADRGPYGCCALVLSAKQTQLPPTWTGGDRIAIHGTSNQASIGLAASLGCLRVKDEEARWLVRAVPPGTSVYIKP